MHVTRTFLHFPGVVHRVKSRILFVNVEGTDDSLVNGASLNRHCEHMPPELTS